MIDRVVEAPAPPVRRGLRAVLADYVALTKPGIVVTLLVTAYCAMVVAAGGFPPAGRAVATLAGLALSAGGAHAVNMWYDADIDRVMERTRNRPVPTGRIPGRRALAFGLVAEALSAVELALAVNVLTALVSVAGFLFYVLVYTMWLKRRTPQNIVIGGAAGAFPPVVGWAAVTGHVGWAAWVMFLIIFLWTPPHFWALALYKQEDYRRAGIPMLPVVRGETATRRQSLVYGVLLLGASLALPLVARVGVGYTVAAATLGLGFVGVLVWLLGERPPATRRARVTFLYSLGYMVGLFGAMVAAVVHP